MELPKNCYVDKPLRLTKKDILFIVDNTKKTE